MNLTGRDLERILKESPVVQQSISHYDAPSAPVILTMLLQDGARVSLIANQVHYTPVVPAQNSASVAKAIPAPPGVAQRLGFDGCGVNNFKAMQDR